MSITTDLHKRIRETENYIAPQVKRSFYRISHVPTGKKGKMRWIFNPSKFVRPFQVASLNILYLFNETLDPSLAGCIPESSLPMKVSEMYGANSIYVSDIKGFFKNVNRTVLYRAVDRMLFKYLQTHTVEKIRLHQAYDLVQKMGTDMTQDDRNALLHVKNERVNYSTLALRVGSVADRLKGQLETIATKRKNGDKNAVLHTSSNTCGYTLVLGQQAARSEHCKEDLRTLSSNTSPELSDIVNNLILNILTVLNGGERLSSQMWEEMMKDCPADCAKVKPVTMLDAMNKAMLTGKKEDRPVIINKITHYSDMGPIGELYNVVNDTLGNRIEFIRRVLYFVVDAGTTHLNTLPEGAATSPMLANILLDSITDQIKHTFRHKPENMIVYMDDISMSYGVPLTREMVAEINEDFDKALNSFGLKRHPKKTKIYNKKGRRRILGINITSYKGPQSGISIRVPRYYRRGMRVVLHRFEKFVKSYSNHLDVKAGMTPDDAYVKANYPEGYTSKSHFSIKSRIREINGKLSWMKCVSTAQAAPYADRISKIKKDYFPKIDSEVKARSIGLIDLHLVPKRR